jgi:deoxyribodipyrimidine photo-lyase
VRTLVLFTRDLRVHDHPALAASCQGSDEVVPLFVLDPALLGGSANRDRFLLECLEDLDGSLRRLGGRLIVRSGDAASEAASLARASRCDRVRVTEDVTAYGRRRTRELAATCAGAGIAVEAMPGHAIVEPGVVAPAGRDGYRVFSPYHRAWLAAPRRRPATTPSRVRVPRAIAAGVRPPPSSAIPTAMDLPPGGERAGRRRMHAFLGRELAAYGTARDALATDATSRLSPYLRFGCVSSLELAGRAAGLPGAEPFLRQLAWRDFFGQWLAADPRLAWRDLRSPTGLERPASLGGDGFEAWCSGRTGVPLVDAGMRQLLREGWMHNRARLVTASFLTRRLGLPWQRGERHFARHLVDGDPANDAGNWQWTAGTGADPRRARTLNPVRQARRYDPDGDYVRRYVPELAHVDGSGIFAPWRDPGLLRRTGYPAPIISLLG